MIALLQSRRALQLGEELSALAVQPAGGEMAVREKAADGQIEAYKVGNYGCDWHHKEAKQG